MLGLAVGDVEQRHEFGLDLLVVRVAEEEHDEEQQQNDCGGDVEDNILKRFQLVEFLIQEVLEAGRLEFDSVDEGRVACVDILDQGKIPTR